MTKVRQEANESDQPDNKEAGRNRLLHRYMKSVNQNWNS